MEKLIIRDRLVSHLLHIDGELAKKVSEGLGLKKLPDALPAAKPVNVNLKKSSALSIILNPPQSFRGRKLGILLSNGADAELFNTLKNSLKDIGATFEVIAPKIGGVQLSDGAWVKAEQNISGGPSVLYDAVAILVSETGCKELIKQAAVRDFIADAFAHFKFIAYVAAAKPLFDKIGLIDELDEGCVLIENADVVAEFIKECSNLRFWKREEVLLGIKQ